ncbi:MAG: hypothetical protein H0Z28_10095 [Archaeoglobus sp.]|nr:hypothetical protein [Archaeoglobus sp.]
MKLERKAVKIEIPPGMYKQIVQLCEQGLYRNPADFFYVAGQKELSRMEERARIHEMLQRFREHMKEQDCEVLADAEVVS